MNNIKWCGKQAKNNNIKLYSFKPFEWIDRTKLWLLDETMSYILGLRGYCGRGDPTGRVHLASGYSVNNPQSVRKDLRCASVVIS